ncbi:hypothetical protein CBQ26_06780 [Deinococcus indicus]|uniref:Uncharacterized protein n=1 Tax=Deinococcus indicus TaxID=223556 RepID=A0A246BRX1_9DEIO|nr:hypothetical protein [Deinococcus indicus]OWL97932.1 hypothetical protein CBQ26_06780 [Deinococcus indicus]
MTAPARWGRAAGLLLALWLTVPGILNPLRGDLLGGVNLVFHEAGHVLLIPAGETLTLLGGSAAQVAVPLACAAAFLWRGDRFAAGVAAYIRDAPLRQLDLITGDPDTHDWWQLLGGWNPQANALHLADPLGRLVTFLALATLIVSVVLAVWDDLR